MWCGALRSERANLGLWRTEGALGAPRRRQPAQQQGPESLVGSVNGKGGQSGAQSLLSVQKKPGFS